MIKKFLVLVYLSVFLFTWINATSALKISVSDTNINEVSLEDMFNYFWKTYDNKIPETYKYIKLNIKWVEDNSELYTSLQKLIYVDVLNNSDVNLRKNKIVTAFQLYSFAEKNYSISLIDESKIDDLKWRKALFSDFWIISKKIVVDKNTFNFKNSNWTLNTRKQIFSDVYKTLSTEHYSKDDIANDKLIDEATKALAKWTWDKYTVYFPPVENKDFNETLNWEYEWIWAYVELEKPWVFKIVSPIADSPAEDAWLRWWDIVTHVDWKEILETWSSNEIISLIKWKAWTEVLLTIKRWEKITDIKVKRAHIIIKEVESKKLNSQTYYIKMKFFWPNISREFRESLDILKEDKKIKKIIFDLRWNGWGYLDQVSDILWHFVEKWKNTAVVKYYNTTQKYESKWYNIVNFWDYKLVFLENGWTASASEIFIWTIKDYFPESTIIGEKSYWKGSVQTIKSYVNWSSLKYTIARWYTWKTEIWIDWIWIIPDIEVIMENYWVEEKDDIQLKKALYLK